MSILKKYTCGQIGNSSDIFFTGTIPTFITEVSVLQDRNLNHILNIVGEKVDALNSSLDISALDKKCFNINKNTTNKALHQLEIDAVCDQAERLADIEDGLNFEIGDQLIKIDLSCLLPAQEGCEQNETSYTISAIIDLFVGEVCDLKEQIEDICNPVSGTSGTSGSAGTSGVSGTSGAHGTSGASGNGTSGTQGSSGTSGTSGTSAVGNPYSCRYYTINYQGSGSGTTVYWEDCSSGVPLSAYFTTQLNICSRVLPTADDAVEIIDNYSCT